MENEVISACELIKVPYFIALDSIYICCICCTINIIIVD